MSEIVIEGLTRTFGEHVAVRPLSARIGPGGITGLLGPNGSGKSTLLRMLVGLVRPDQGTATVAGAALDADGAAVRRQVTYLPGEIGVYGELSGREHLKWLVRGRERAALPRALELAGELGLPLARRVHGYSHGMKRQLLFAAAMAPQVPVRILDEPTEGLDPTKRARVLQLLQRDVAERDTTILFSSHHLGEVEQGCDRILFLHRGELVDEERAQVVQEGARRMARLTYASGSSAPAPDRLATALASLAPDAAALEARVEGDTATLLLPGDDPGEALRLLLADPGLPSPTALSFGTLSLQELYRVLYGEEGL